MAARAALTAAVLGGVAVKHANIANATRRGHIGSGMRGDKRRTYRFQEDRVVDHLTGRAAQCSAVLDGAVDLLWP